MIGRACTVNSVIKPEIIRGRHSIYGIIVGYYQDEVRTPDKIRGYEIKYRTIVLMELYTFDKGNVYEIPIECIKLHESIEVAEDYCKLI